MYRCYIARCGDAHLVPLADIEGPGHAQLCGGERTLSYRLVLAVYSDTAYVYKLYCVYIHLLPNTYVVYVNIYYT